LPFFALRAKKGNKKMVATALPKAETASVVRLRKSCS
jgi:hypothetical protein